MTLRKAVIGAVVCTVLGIQAEVVHALSLPVIPQAPSVPFQCPTIPRPIDVSRVTVIVNVPAQAARPTAQAAQPAQRAAQPAARANGR